MEIAIDHVAKSAASCSEIWDWQGPTEYESRKSGGFNIALSRQAKLAAFPLFMQALRSDNLIDIRHPVLATAGSCSLGQVIFPADSRNLTVRSPLDVVTQCVNVISFRRSATRQPDCLHICHQHRFAGRIVVSGRSLRRMWFLSQISEKETNHELNIEIPGWRRFSSALGEFGVSMR